jgi:streptogrisin C
MLTAGHCMPGATGFPDAWATAFTTVAKPSVDYYFGTRYTTTMGGALGSPADGSQDQYGDWALLRGSTYLPYVYNCTNVTGYCSSLPVGTASWVLPSDNAAICTSGRTTGQTCRQHVVQPSADAWIQGVYIRHLTMFQADASGSCDTVRGGDSGGAVYQAMSSRPGFMRALGMVTATDGCTSYYTRLSGVRAWDSSITMPVL